MKKTNKSLQNTSKFTLCWSMNPDHQPTLKVENFVQFTWYLKIY